MKKNDYAHVDAESISVDMKQLVNLMDIVIDDFADNGSLEGRRELTVSALYIIKDHLSMLADMQMGVVDRMREIGRESVALRAWEVRYD